MKLLLFYIRGPNVDPDPATDHVQVAAADQEQYGRTGQEHHQGTGQDLDRCRRRRSSWITYVRLPAFVPSLLFIPLSILSIGGH